MMNEKDDHDKVERLEFEVERLKRVNQALMKRVESSTDAAGSAYSLFESNLLLQNKVKAHTDKLVKMNRDLQREIREHKKTEEALKRERDFSSTVIDISGALVVILDHDGKIVRFNRTCERITGYTSSEVLGKCVWDVFLVPDDVEMVKSIFKELQAGNFPNVGENDWVTKEGERRRINWLNSVICDDKGNVEYIIGTGIDITERRKAEEQLRLYHRIFTSSKDGIAIMNPDGRVVEMNPAIEAYHSQVKDGYWDSHGRPRIDRKRQRIIQKQLRTTGQYRGEFRYELKDGGDVFIDMSLTPILNEDDQVQYMVAMGRNITQSILDQRALASRLRYEEGLAGCSQALLEPGDIDEVITRALHYLLNAADVGRVYIFENEEVPEEGLCTSQKYEVCAPGVSVELDNPLLQKIPYTGGMKLWHDALSQNKHFGDFTRSIPQDLAEVMEAQNILSILVIPIWVDKEWYGFIGFDEVKEEREWGDEEIRLLRTAAEMIGCYISRRKAAEALRTSEARFRTLVENSNNVIFSLNGEGHINYLSPKFVDYSGYAPGKFIGKHVGSIIHEADAPAFIEWVTKGVSKGEDAHRGYPARVKHKDGELRWFVSNASVIRDEEGNVSEIIGVAHDITDLKQALDNLEEVNRHLKETQTQLVQSEKMASLGMLVAGIAHEINTPVGSITSMHDTLMRATEKLKSVLDAVCDAKAPEHAKLESMMGIIDDANQVIKDATERVTTIIKRLRSFARLDQAELDEAADIHEGIEDTLTLIHHEIKHQITVNRNYGKIPRIACHMGQLNQVFVNILINARQAIRGKGEITITTREENGYISIEFQDTGIGIPKDQLSKIFDPGFTTKGVGVGTGLGLSICYQIIQDHRGEIRVKSEVGKGSTFTLLIPTDLKKQLEKERENLT